MGLFWSHERFETIRARVAEGHEPWASAHAALIREADEAMGLERMHIRQLGGSPYFRQDAVYVPGQDGVKNAEADTRSSKLTSRASQACVCLATAYRFTGEKRYADKALDLLHCWTINQDTRMFATGFVFDHATAGMGYGGDIVLFASMHGMFLTAYLLMEYPGWNLAARAGVKRWIRAMIEPQRPLMFLNGREMYNNWEDARLLYLSRGALALDDADLLLEVFGRWRQTLPMKMTEEGQLPRETERTRSMHYTLFALNSMTQVAEIAKQQGEDLYDLTVNGRSLRKAIDYAAGYLMDMDRWPFTMIEPMGVPEAGSGANSEMGVFELAYEHWGDERYVGVIDRYGGRPVKGHASLMTVRG